MTSKSSPPETIYVRLLDEGTDVWRPAQGRQVGLMAYEVLPTPGYDPKDERWEFVPGRVVKCRWEAKSGGPAFVACEPAVAPPEIRARSRNVVEFVGRRAAEDAPGIETRVDDTPIEQLVSAAVEIQGQQGHGPWQGPEPYTLLPPQGNLLGGRGAIQLLVCAGCREPGCDPVYAAIEVFDGEVVWSEFAAGKKLESVGPFVFDRQQYEAAVARAVEWDTKSS